MTFPSQLIKFLISTAFLLALGGCATTPYKPGTYLFEFISDSKELILSMKVPIENNLGEQHSGQIDSNMNTEFDPEVAVMNIRGNLCKTMPAVRSIVTSPSGKVLLDEKCPQSK